MTNLHEKILQLRTEGKTYNQIVEILGCSKGTVSYYLGVNQRAKTNLRTTKYRAKQHPYRAKLDRFLNQTEIETKKLTKFKNSIYQLLYYRVVHFQTQKFPGASMSFNVQDVINKIGENPVCYLSGEPIDISDTRSYEFDHIIPTSRGGDNSLTNLAITTKKINRAKGNMTPEEFISLCKQVVENTSDRIRTDT